MLLFLALIGSRARAITERRFLELGWMSASFLDLLQGLPTLKMFGRSREQVETIRDVSHQYGNTTMEVLRTAFETAFVLEMSTTIATALVAVEIGLRLVNGELAVQPGAGGADPDAGVLLRRGVSCPCATTRALPARRPPTASSRSSIRMTPAESRRARSQVPLRTSTSASRT